ncbi:MAG: glycosyltransferase, partial [Butyrivibrio sp.]|nr:glycosyltransferase [Butyrivibrio sp.]
MSERLVSIIMPVYNVERYLQYTLESVIGQTYSNWECLCIDDCSSDSSSEIIKKYSEQDSRIKYIKLPENMGVAGARNEGIKIA